MCGIVGAFHRQEGVLRSLVKGLQTLEYRGYDSVGVGVVCDGEIVIRKRAGRIGELEGALEGGNLADGRIGIGHSRWATHGPPTDENAHPHPDSDLGIALVHNGIIENYLELRRALVDDGISFRSDTDTEVLAHLVSRELRDTPSLAEALRRALRKVQGYYAVAVLRGGESPEMVCAREGPPLCVAVTDEAGWLASDALAILPHTRKVSFLEDGDIADVSPGRIVVTDGEGREVERAVQEIDWEEGESDKGGWSHFMLKEIHEQPDVLARATFSRLDPEHGDVRLEGDFWKDENLRSIERVQVVACGTALHAGYVARYLIEGLAGIPVDVDYASEFRYRDPVIAPNTLVLGISQSGETADTLAAMRLGIERGCRPVAICNSVGSTMVRESEAVLRIHAGSEIGVASTKAFVAMLVSAYLMAIRLGRAREVIGAERGRVLLRRLEEVRPGVERLLARESVARVEEIARRHAWTKGFLFLGRGVNYPIALEGALKLKEISYVHAEGYPAGEMKHGPIALIEPGMTTVVVAPADDVADKVRSNIEQVRARGGHVVVVGSDPQCHEVADESIEIPHIGPWLSPILNVIPLQLFAYFVARIRGCDIDKPRNLAKSVTVE
jgi:glutamine---fructose-6-phosphate transaminase (isomerizing)